jgi:hypothetical protein
VALACQYQTKPVNNAAATSPTPHHLSLMVNPTCLWQQAALTQVYLQANERRLARSDNGKADQRRTIGSAISLDSIRRLIQRVVIRFLYAANA